MGTPKIRKKKVKAFLGFLNFYKGFIQRFSDLAIPLTELTKKGAPNPFKLGKSGLIAFEQLKKKICSKPILAQFDPELNMVIKPDALGFATEGILLQEHPEGLKPIAFYSKKLNNHEINYDIHDKKLLAIIRCLQE